MSKRKAIVRKRSPKFVVFYLVGGWPSANDGISQEFKTRATASRALARYLKTNPDDRKDYEVRQS